MSKETNMKNKAAVELAKHKWKHTKKKDRIAHGKMMRRVQLEKKALLNKAK